jgi:hypothetical protein
MENGRSQQSKSERNEFSLEYIYEAHRLSLGKAGGGSADYPPVPSMPEGGSGAFMGR